MIDQFIDKRAYQDLSGAGRFLTAEQMDTFNREGCLVLRGVLDLEEVRGLRDSADKLFSATESEWIGAPETKADALRDYVRSPTVQGIIEDLNGPSDVLLGFLYRKRKTEPTPKLWHQDVVYWDTSDARVMAMFTPLTPMHNGNGAIHYLPASHRLGRLFHRPAANYNLVCDVTAFGEPRVVELAPGDVMLVHSLTLHYSPANVSDEPRINYGLHFHNVGTRVVRDQGADDAYK